MSENKILYSDVNLSQDVKRAGKGSVDVANGRLSFVHEDVSIPFGKSSFTLSHVYDGSSGKWRYNVEEYIAVGEDYNVASGVDGVGYTAKTMKKVDCIGRETGYIINCAMDYTHNLDKKIKFVNFDNGEVLLYDDIREYIILYVKNGARKLYVKHGDVYRLEKIRDNEAAGDIYGTDSTTGGELKNVYDEYGKLCAIKNNFGDTISISGDEITGFSDEKVIATRLQGSDEISGFEYRGCNYSLNGRSAFEYNEDGLLSKVIDRTGYSVEYSWQENKVNAIVERFIVGEISENQNVKGVATEQKETKIVREKEIGSTIKVKITSPSNIVSHYSFADSSTSSSPYRKYSLIGQYEEGAADKNLIKNARFDNAEEWKYAVGEAICEPIFSTEHYLTGNRSLKIRSKSIPTVGKAYLSQAVNLKPGKYCAAASVLAVGNDSMEEGKFFSLAMKIAGGGVVTKVGDVQKKNEAVIFDGTDSWQTIYVQFDVTAKCDVTLTFECVGYYDVYVDEVLLTKQDQRSSAQPIFLSHDITAVSANSGEQKYYFTPEQIGAVKVGDTNVINDIAFCFESPYTLDKYADMECIALMQSDVSGKTVFAKQRNKLAQYQTTVPIKILLHKDEKITDTVEVNDVEVLAGGYSTSEAEDIKNENFLYYTASRIENKNTVTVGKTIFDSITKYDDFLRLDTTKNYRNIVERAEYVSNADADETTRNAAYASEKRETYYENKNDSSKKITSSKVYDDRYRLTEETDERGNKTTYTYNADNTPASVRLPNGEVINYEYDEFFRVSKITKGGKSIEYEYLYDMPVKVCTDGKEYEIAYDGNCEIKSIKEKSGGEQKVLVEYERKRSAKYETANGVNYVTERKEDETLKTEYDKYGNETAVKRIMGDGEETLLSYEYDDERKLKKVSDFSRGEGKQIITDAERSDNYAKTTTTNEFSTVTEEATSENGLIRTKSIAFDGKYPVVGKYKITENYEFEKQGDDEYPDGRLVKEKVTIEDDRNALGEKVLTTEHVYDELGRAKMTRRFVGDEEKLADRELYFYEEGDQTATGTLKTINYLLGDNTELKAEYTYDKNGNIASEKFGKIGYEKTTSYKYDSNNRLVREDNEALGKSYEYEYDDSGNRTIMSEGAYSPGKEIPASVERRVGAAFCGTSFCGTAVASEGVVRSFCDTTLYEYDERGRLLDERIAYDNAGRPIIYRNNAVEWNGSQMTKYGRNIYEYDGNNYRVFKQTPTEKTYYNYDDSGNLRFERRGRTEINYVYDSNGIQGMRVTVPTKDAATYYASEEYYYIKDRFGNVRVILDKSGNIMVEYNYDAWGNFEATSVGNAKIGGIAVDLVSLNAFTYRGYYYDKESGLYYLVNRYYDPITGRFISPDDISYLNSETIGGLNLYSYCLNNPIFYVDPDGHAPIPWWGKLLIGIGVVLVGAVVTALTAGTGAGFMVAFGAALLTSAKAVAISTAISAGIGLAVGGITTGTWEGAFNGMLDGAVDGLMWGGIFAGGAQVLSGVFKGVATIANNAGKLQTLKQSPIFSPDRLKGAKEIAGILKKGQKFYDYGGTLVRFGKFAHIDVSTKALLHLATFGFKHIPIGTVIAGIIGGF